MKWTMDNAEFAADIQTCHCETGAHTGCGNLFSLTMLDYQRLRDLDSHTSDIGHWFGMTGFVQNAHFAATTL